MYTYTQDKNQQQKAPKSDDFLTESTFESQTINCASCKTGNHTDIYLNNYSNSLTCLFCVINSCVRQKEKDHGKDKDISAPYAIPESDIKILFEIRDLYYVYLERTKRIDKNDLLNFLKIREEKVLNRDLIQNLIFQIFLRDLIRYAKNNELLLFKTIEHTNTSIKGKFANGRFEKLFILKLKNTNFIQELERITLDEKEIDKVFSLLFIGPNFDDEVNQIKESLKESKRCLKQYELEDNSLYRIRIFQSPNYIQKLYTIQEYIGSKSETIYKKIIGAIIRKNNLKFHDFIPLGDLIENLYQKANKILKINYKNLNKQEIENCALKATLRTLNLEKLFPLLIDKDITEIYYDNPKSCIYIDHIEFGRCVTEYELNKREIESIKTFLRIESNKKLDHANPSIKHTIQNKYFKCRVAIDIAPLNQNQISINIRKINQLVFTIDDLISRKTLNSKLAAFLLFCIIHKLNITVVGITNTGKTTLINTLDLYVPRSFRKIYVEEAPESVDQNSFNLHQLKLLVDAKSRVQTLNQKTEQIYRLLHRNPDFIYLGEILNLEEANAMFHCLSAGLIGFQTIHARSIKSLLNRWQYHFNISPHCFNDLDIVVLMKHSANTRYVSQICSIRCNKKIEIVNFAKFDPFERGWHIDSDFLSNHEFLSKISNYGYSNQDILDSIDFIRQVIEYCSSKKKMSISKKIEALQYLWTKFMKGYKTLIRQKASNILDNYLKKGDKFD